MCLYLTDNQVLDGVPLRFLDVEALAILPQEDSVSIAYTPSKKQKFK